MEMEVYKRVKFKSTKETNISGKSSMKKRRPLSPGQLHIVSPTVFAYFNSLLGIGLEPGSEVGSELGIPEATLARPSINPLQYS